MNLKELSEALGLSPTTVSRALNGYPEVNDRTRSRVVEAAKRHGYVPNSMAKRLATGRAMTIGHVVPISEHDMINPIFAEFIAGAGEIYSEVGYNMLLRIVPQSAEEESYRAIAAANSVDGLVVHAPRRNDPRIRLLTEMGMTFIAHGRGDVETDYSWLDINNRRSFGRATEYLIELGHRRIALLNGLETMLFAWRRRRGYEDALTSAGIALDPELMFSAEMTEPFGYHAARAALRGPSPPTAFLASSMTIGMGAHRAITEQGLTMGRDVSVIIHDDALSFMPNYGEVPLFTSATSSIRAAGKRLAELLIEMIEGRITDPVTELWETEMILGSSTGPAPESTP